jgi:hypothetical protein
VRADEETQSNGNEECLDRVRPEEDARASAILREAADTVVRVAPDQIGDHRIILIAGDRQTDRRELAKRRQARRESPMDAEGSVPDDGAQREESEECVEGVPQFWGTIGRVDLVVEPVKSVDVREFVIATEKKDAGPVAAEEGQKEDHDVDASWAPVDVVAEEEQRIGIGIGGELLEDTDQVPDAPVDVADDGAGRGDTNKGGLALQKRHCGIDQGMNHGALKHGDGKFALRKRCGRVEKG